MIYVKIKKNKNLNLRGNFFFFVLLKQMDDEINHFIFLNFIKLMVSISFHLNHIFFKKK